MNVLSRVCCVLLLLPGAGLPADESGEELQTADVKLLADHNVKADAQSLVAYFRDRTLDDGQRRGILDLIRQMGDDSFEKREEASQAILKYGESAKPFLQGALKDPDAERARRVREALSSLEGGPGPSLTMSAVRTLARTSPEQATAVLLDYLPFAEELAVEEEVLHALVLVSKAPLPADPAIVKALADKQVQRRAAAAFVLGRRPELRWQLAVRRLLKDADPVVRLRSIQALLAAHDRSAVPALIDLLGAPLGDRSGVVEELLTRLGSDREELPYLGESDPASRAKQRQAWMKWWQEKGDTIHLAQLTRRPPHLGITIVPEMHANKVWEVTKAGKVLWELGVPGCPIDAHPLPGGRILVAELNGGRVTERDRSGKVLWEHAVQTPIACQRLPNGNTWISTNHRYFIVTPKGVEVSAYAPENGFFIHSVQRQPNGKVVCISMTGEIREIDPKGKVLYKVPLPEQGSWSGVEAVSGGKYLAVNLGSGKVLEVDRKGKVVWEHQEQGACYASRLPNGNTMIVNNSNGLREVTRAGKTVWEHRIPTSLWRAHQR
jgi:HEAT repeat protein